MNKITTTGLLLAAALCGQMRDNQDKTLKCDERQNQRQFRACKITEQSQPATGLLQVDPGRNGGITVRGWSRSDTLVRARIETWANSEAEANQILSQVQPALSGGQVRATGPEGLKQAGWAVSYEIFTPHMTDVTAAAHNGGLHVTDVRGQLALTTVNGGLHLARLAGDLDASTRNGGVHVQLGGRVWEGGRFRVHTQNGGVHVQAPSDYSARLHLETVNGGIQSNFPLPKQDERRPRKVDLQVGNGGPLMEFATVNGGVHIQRQ